MANRRRLNLSLSMASPVQREAWEVISAIPPGQRTEAVCKIILEANARREMLDMVLFGILRQPEGRPRPVGHGRSGAL